MTDHGTMHRFATRLHEHPTIRFRERLPTARTITVDLRQLAGTSATFTWYDPTTGTARPVIHRRTTARFELATPGRNHGGDYDWLLIARVP